MMKRAYSPGIKISIILFLLLSPKWGSKSVKAQSPAPSMSLQECINYALEHNSLLNNARLNIETRKRKMDETISIGLPQISGEVTMNYNFERPISYIPAVLFGGEPGTFAPVAFSTSYTGRAAINFEQMLFIGSYFIGLKAAKSYIKAGHQEKMKTEIDLIAAISKAYYLVLINYERGKLVENNYARLDSLLQNTQAMYETGLSEQAEIDRIRVQYNNAKVEKETFVHSLMLSYMLLKSQMGMEIDNPLTLKDRIADIPFELSTKANLEADFKYENRIEYSLQEATMDLVKLDIKNTRSEYLPSLYLYGNYGANTGQEEFSDLFRFSEQWNGFGSVGLRIKLPIFDGLKKTRVIQQKKIQLQLLENSVDQLKRDINVQIQQAKAAWEKGIKNIKAQEENIALAKNIYEAANLKYKAGTGSNIEVVTADAALTQAQTNYQSALYDALVAKVDLEKAYGKLSK